jgi:Protein of unknown function (DUF667)
MMQPPVARGALSIRLAYQAQSNDWMLLAVDVAAALAVQDVSYRCIKSLQLCAAMSVRGAFTSDIVYSHQVTQTTLWTGSPRSCRADNAGY